MSPSKVSLENNPTYFVAIWMFGTEPTITVYGLHQATPIYQVIDTTIRSSTINMHKLGACGIFSFFQGAPMHVDGHT